VVVCEAAHEAHIAPWLRRASEARWWRLGEDIEALVALVDERTSLVALPHASNVTGNVYDVEAAARAVRDKNPETLIVVDGVALAAHRRPVCAEADAYVVAFHKCFGPHLACAALSPRFAALRGSPRRWELGTVSAEACAGVAALGKYLEDLGGSIDGFYAKARALCLPRRAPREIYLKYDLPSEDDGPRRCGRPRRRPSTGCWPSSRPRAA